MATVKEMMERLATMDENETVCCVLWTMEDVHGVADNNEETLTDDEARKVLERAESKHDCEYGITWETINDHMIDVINERPEDDDEMLAGDIEICPNCSMEMIYSIDGDTCLEEKWSCPNCDGI